MYTKWNPHNVIHLHRITHFILFQKKLNKGGINEVVEFCQSIGVSDQSLEIISNSNTTGKDFINCINGEGDETTHASIYGITLEDSKKIYTEISKMLKLYTLNKEKKRKTTDDVQRGAPSPSSQPPPPPPLSSSSDSQPKPRKAAPPPNSDAIILAPPCKHEGVPLFSPSVVSLDLIAEIRKSQPSAPLFNTDKNRAVAGKRVKFYYDVPDVPEIETPCGITYALPPVDSMPRFPIKSKKSSLFF